jgi:hypothetical protein
MSTWWGSEREVIVFILVHWGWSNASEGVINGDDIRKRVIANLDVCVCDGGVEKLRRALPTQPREAALP